MEKAHQIYEGKAKIVYATDSPELLIHYFKDETTCFNAAKRGIIAHKGEINNQISARVFQYLETKGIPTHFVRLLNEREVLVKKAKMFPLEVIVRNIAAGSLARTFRIEEGRRLPCPIIEYCFKDDAMNDPMVNEYHIRALGFASDEDFALIKHYVLKINALLTEYFLLLHLDLVDFKVEFGKIRGKIVLADEISPDTARLWEVGTGERLDKDRFRQDLGHIEEAYQEVLSRVSR